MARGILEVQLIDTEGLADSDMIGKMDPYVAIQYRSQEREQRRPRCNYTVGDKGQGRSPSWNRTFKFQVQHSGSTDHHQKLVLRIMDEDTFSEDNFVGEATINAADVISLGIERGFAELSPCKYSVVLADRTCCGKIRVIQSTDGRGG